MIGTVDVLCTIRSAYLNLKKNTISNSMSNEGDFWIGFSGSSKVLGIETGKISRTA